jgi:hypothetical protein
MVFLYSFSCSDVSHLDQGTPHLRQETLNFEFVISSESVVMAKLISRDRIACSMHFGRSFETQGAHMDNIRLYALAEQGPGAVRGLAGNGNMVR